MSTYRGMLFAFFDIEGIVHVEISPKSVFANAAFLVEVLKRLRDAVKRKIPDKWKNCDSSIMTRQPLNRRFLTNNSWPERNIPVIPHHCQK